VSTPPEGSGPPSPFSYEELADLQAGQLTAGEESELRMRMEDHPDRARKMLADLAAVDAIFPDPPNVDAPLEVPHQVTARWQLAIAEEAERRASGDDDDGEPGHSSPNPDGSGSAGRPTDS
jgi:hypothetical protein